MLYTNEDLMFHMQVQNLEECTNDDTHVGARVYADDACSG